MKLICTLLAAALTLAAASASAPPGNAWSRVAGPTPGPPLAIGGAAHGCLSGAAELPVDGVGYEAIRLSRKRNFGLPETVDFVEQLGRRMKEAGLPVFYVGDMAQPRGGPLPFGHASHQTGVDVDIWFTLETDPALPPAAREDMDLPSMLLPDFSRVDPRRFGPRQVTFLETAAADPRVDRIFVSPVIKLALCHGFAGATAHGSGWLHRLSPWWGHDDHFHVRLHCPEDSPDCETQKPVPPGDGCDASLADWARHPNPPVSPSPMAPPPSRRLPAACTAILEQVAR